MARMRRCLILRQGASPLRPCGHPFPSAMRMGEGRHLSRVRKAAPKARALDKCLPSPKQPTEMRERGPPERAASRNMQQRSNNYGPDGAPLARMRRCLILRQGDKPPETPRKNPLTEAGLLMEAKRGPTGVL